MTKNLIVLLLAILISPFALSQNTPVTLDRLVPIERQKELGLDTLTPGQRAGVVKLLQEVYQLGRQADSKPAAPVTRAAPRTAPSSVIETQIDGDFEGWEGETIVKTINGQIWQQTEYHYHYHYAFMPKVLIYPGNGGYKMKVDGTDKAVGVQLLR